MIQPLHEALTADRLRVDRSFLAIISAPELRGVDAMSTREGARQDVRRIASTLFCSMAVDPSMVSFAKLRTAQHWGLSEEEVDVLISTRLLAETARLMTDLHILAAVPPPIASTGFANAA